MHCGGPTQAGTGYTVRKLGRIAVQIKQSIYRIENDLMNVNKQLCVIVSQISNIISVLNNMDKHIILK